MHLRSLYLCVVLCFIDVSVCQECRNQLQNNPGVNIVTLTLNHNILFNFDDDDSYFCGPSNMRPFTITITYSSPVLLTEIGIHGYNQVPIFSTFDNYVTSFSLSFSEDGDNFTEYIRDTESTEFTVPDEGRHNFELQPPITASSIKITVNDWNDQPCMSLRMLGCNYSDVVVDRRTNITNGTANNSDTSLIGDMTVVRLTITESVTTTATVIQTTKESFTIYHTVTVAPIPSPTQSSGAAASTSCSSDTDNTPIYVAVAIVIVGLLITIIVVIVGVLMCHRYQKEKKSDGSSSPLTVKYKSSANSTGVSVVEVDNDLYGKEILQPQSQSSPENNEIMLYDSVKMEPDVKPDVTETVDNPQYGDSMKQSDTTANPKPNENAYSYAIP